MLCNGRTVNSYIEEQEEIDDSKPPSGELDVIVLYDTPNLEL